MTANVLTIENDGQDIRATNYFEGEYARRGAFYLTVNAGAFRLLVPPVHESVVGEFRTAREVIVSRGPWPAEGHRDALEILFDDHTDRPFSLHFGAEQIDRFPRAEDAAGVWVFSAWVTSPAGPARIFSATCYYRVVEGLPYLKSQGRLNRGPDAER
jgi:hypothetical protein